MADLILKLQSSVSTLVLLILFSCEKQGHYLPAMTREGRNTIGYKMSDGTIFGGAITDGEDIYQNSQNQIVVEYNHVETSFHTKTEFRLMLAMKYDSLSEWYVLADATYNENDYQAKIDSSKSNYFEVTYHNTNRNIISGNFDLNFIEIGTDTIFTSDTTYYFDTLFIDRTKEGRFDIRYPD